MTLTLTDSLSGPFCLGRLDFGRATGQDGGTSTLSQPNPSPRGRELMEHPVQRFQFPPTVASKTILNRLIVIVGEHKSRVMECARIGQRSLAFPGRCTTCGSGACTAGSGRPRRRGSSRCRRRRWRRRWRCSRAGPVEGSLVKFGGFWIGFE